MASLSRTTLANRSPQYSTARQAAIRFRARAEQRTHVAHRVRRVTCSVRARICVKVSSIIAVSLLLSPCGTHRMALSCSSDRLMLGEKRHALGYSFRRKVSSSRCYFRSSPSISSASLTSPSSDRCALDFACDSDASSAVQRRNALPNQPPICPP